MKQGVWTVIDNQNIAKDTWRMKLAGDMSAFTAPGQFLNLSLPGFYLRRPFSICDWTDTQATLIYKVLGLGTDHMTTLQPGTQLDVLSGLGKGFSLENAGERPLLIGGGVGVPPLYRLCAELRAKGLPVTVALGFGTAAEVFYEAEFKALGAQVLVATMDGSAGSHGTALDDCDFIKNSYFYACGPTPMLKALCAQAGIPGELSLEERMGCGFGACVGCTVFTKAGPQKVCKDGPVFNKEALQW